MEEVPAYEPYRERIYPSVLQRVQALLLDVWAVLGVQLYVSSAFFPEFEGRYVLLKIMVFFAVFFLYEPLMNMSGGTIGYRTLGLMIRKSTNPGERISARAAFKRTFIKILLGWVSFLSISLDPFRRALHDKLAGTLVLSVKEKA